MMLQADTFFCFEMPFIPLVFSVGTAAPDFLISGAGFVVWH